MLKNKLLYKLIITIVLLSTLGLAACTTGTDAAEAIPTPDAAVAAESNQASDTGMAENAAQNGNATVKAASNAKANMQEIVPAGELTETEIEGLTYMREEEKLARDVYLTLYDQWNLPIFNNIAKAEQMHTDAVKNLLVTYSITDPVTNDEIGVFTNPDLQSLYDQLVEQGSQSVEEALKVGLAIEEIDILDLKEYLAETDDPNIQQVYQNLMMGSGNHLRAFVGNYQRQTGDTYAPQYLSPEDYQSILNAGNNQGSGGGYGKGNGQGGGRRNSN